MPRRPTYRVGFVSLGCPKATVDAERILSQLRAEGYQLVAEYGGADLVVVNTCGFIDSAVAESLEAIGEALAANGRVVVAGCLGAREEEIRAVHPSVLAVIGPDNLAAVMAAIHQHLPPRHDARFDLLPPGGLKLTPRHYAYLKIAEGCNQQCSFCIIPSMRGRLVSRAFGDILDEASKLVQAGVKELLIVAQDTAAWGLDQRYRTAFWQGRPLKSDIATLARELGGLGAWLRLHYIYPYPHIDRLVELMAEGVILPYLDVPMQHASPTILKAMRRPADSENMLRRIERWREICPDITLRSTFIVGFPGESEGDFNHLLDFIDAARLDRAGAFAYSPVNGAAANQLAGALPDDLREERREIFMEHQSAISADRLQQRVGQSLEVVVDDYDSDSSSYLCRSRAEAPEIDGNIIVSGEEGVLAIGERYRLEVVAADEHDLYAELPLAL
jgi:ribosomal protein S12 methylthiotransferase